MTIDGADREIGRLDGRMTAMETRMDRHESYMADQLRCASVQLGSMDKKLDDIAISAAETRAEAGGQRRVMTLGISILAVLCAIAGAIASIHAGFHL